jgi:FkbM family methyltransferase
MFRKLIRQTCASQLKRQGLAVIEPKFSVTYLAKYGFEIATLVDIGVFAGTPVLYDLFPTTRTVLIDPMPDVPQRCQQWLDDARRDMIVLPFAAGSADAEIDLDLTRSTTSLLERRDKPDRASDGVVRARVRRLDDLLRDQGIAGPYGLKIDTEGYELEVIRGAGETLRSTAFVIAEVSIRNRFVNGYTFAELIAEMDGRGFAVADILTVHGHSRHTDLLFVPKASPVLDRFDLGRI